MNSCAVIVLILTILTSFAGCTPVGYRVADQRIDDGTWVWSADNGDKPGTGLRLVIRDQMITGTYYLLDPSKPDDFSAGLASPLPDLRMDGREIQFTIRLGSANGPFAERKKLKLEQDLHGEVGKQVHGQMMSELADSAVTDVILIRTE